MDQEQGRGCGRVSGRGGGEGCNPDLPVFNRGGGRGRPQGHGGDRECPQGHGGDREGPQGSGGDRGGRSCGRVSQHSNSDSPPWP
jgi:hypothetical protein